MSALLSELANLANAYDESRISMAHFNALKSRHDAEDAAAAAQDLADEQRAHEIKAVAPALAAIQSIRRIDRGLTGAALICASVADMLETAGHSHTVEFVNAINALRDVVSDMEAA